MNKIKFYALAICLMGGFSLCNAQESTPQQDFERRMEEHIAKQADDFAVRFSLDGEKKQQFVVLFKELSKQRFKYFRLDDMSLDKDASSLTTDEANKKLQEYFDWRSQQIVNEYNRLEMEKQYSAKLSEILTPQQVLEVILPKARNDKGRGDRGGRRPMGGGRK